MNISFFGLDRAHADERDFLHNCLDEILESGQLLQSSYTKALETRLCELSNRNYAVATSSCTDALFFALKACEISEGDEVIVPAYSFFASATCILQAGAKPVFLDVDKNHLMLCSRELEKKISKRTKAIINVHLFGQMNSITEIESLCKSKNIKLIEDAAQAIGCRSNGRSAGSFGNASCISFDPTKVIGGISTGGALLTDDEGIYQKTKSLQMNGRDFKNGRLVNLGLNSKVSELNSALIHYRLKNVDLVNQERRNIYALYQEKLKDLKEVILPTNNPEHINNAHKFVIFCEQRDELNNHLTTRGIETKIHYPQALVDEPLFKNYANLDDDFTNARTAARQSLSLPIYPQLTKKEINLICEQIAAFFHK